MGGSDGEVLVTGGRGTLGRFVVQHLEAAGVPVRLLSRRSPPANGESGARWVTGDLTDPAAVRGAVHGVGAVVHCASNFLKYKQDLVAARVLAEAAAAAGRPHVVYVSIVGVDRIPLGYYAVKRDVETLLLQSGLPVTIQRATQFHELFLRATGLLRRLPVVPVPAGFRFQPIAADEVAARLVALVSAEPRGRVDDIGGPEVHRGEDLVKACLGALGARRPVVPLPVPGRTAAAYRAGHNLAPGHAFGSTTFAEFLRSTRAGG
jgi:uncharacterized protein YbjT (DUF2867 family)